MSDPSTGPSTEAARGAGARRGEVRALLSSPWFRRLLGARLASQAGDGLLQAALATFVLFSPERQATAGGVALVFAALLLPYSVIGPFAGVLLDRWRRRQVLVWGNLARASAIAVIAWQVLSGEDGLWLAVVVLVALGLNRLTLTAQAAALPNTVPAHLLVTANAVAPTAGTIVSATMTVAGAVLHTGLGGGDRGSFWVVVLTGVAVAASALIAWRIPIGVLGPHGDEHRERLGDVLAGLRAGVRHLRRRPLVPRALLMAMSHRFGFGVVLVNALLLTRNALNAPEAADTALGEMALVGGAASVGALLGAVITPAIVRRIGPIMWPATMIAMMAILGVGAWIAAGALAATQDASATAVLAFLVPGGVVVGVTATATKVCADAIGQRMVDDDHRGRVFSIYDIGLNVGLMAGVSLAALTMPDDGVAPTVLLTLSVVLLLVAALHVRLRHLVVAPTS